MAKSARNEVGSVVLDRPAAASARGHFKLWPSFSSASFRRVILDAMRCSGGGCGGGKHSLKSTIEEAQEQQQQQQQQQQPEPKNGAKSLRWELRRESNSKLSELLRLPEPSEEEEQVKRKTKALEELKGVVKRLQQQLQNDGVLEAAREVRRLTRDNSEARTTLALLGAIPPLVALLDAVHVSSQIAALYALLNLAIANDANKAAIVKAGAIHKMLKLIQPPSGPPDTAVSEAIIANFLGLSALDSNKPIIGSSGAIPFLVKALKEQGDSNDSQAKQDALRALYNISILPLNVFHMLETDVIPFLTSKLGDMDVSERILSILSNVVSMPEGRKAIGGVPEAFPILIDVLNWTDSPGCQEKASYILMVMAHKAHGDRQAMIDAGIVSTLLELTLLGSTLAQKRASRILECLRVDKGKQVSESYAGGFSQNMSAPLCGASASSSEPTQRLNSSYQEEVNDMMSEEAKAVKQLVQQSLQNNMKRIAERANLPQDFVPSDHFKALTSSSTSKSLPF